MEAIDKDYYMSTCGLLKKIKDFPGYWVSEHGKVYSEKRKCFKPLSPRVNKGYLAVDLYKEDKKYEKYIHRLVAEAFISNPDNLPQVNHIDEDKFNNSIDNLEWSTPRDNIRYSKCRPVIDLTTGAIYPSAVDAGKALNIHNHVIGTSIKKRGGKYKNHRFMFLRRATEESVNTIEIFRKKYEIPELFTEEKFVDLFGDYLNYYVGT